MSDPGWIITTIVGAVVGALVSSYGSVVTYPLRRLRKDALEGTWHEYHVSFLNGKLVVRTCLLKISKGLVRPYSIEFTHYVELGTGKKAPDLSYSGTLKRELGHMIFNLTGVDHEETLMYRFSGRIPSNSSLIPGIWLSYDHDNNPASGLAILSRGELSPDQATASLKSLEQGQSAGVLRILSV